MAKKTSVKGQLAQNAQQQAQVNRQIEDLQKRRRDLKREAEELEHARQAELGQALLKQLNLNDQDIDAAFAAIKELPTNQQED